MLPKYLFCLPLAVLATSCAELTTISSSLNDAAQQLTQQPSTSGSGSSVAAQRRKIESTGEKVGLFYIMRNGVSSPAWVSSYIDPMEQGLSYDAAYNSRLSDANDKLRSLNAGVSGNPYFIEVGGY